MRGKFNISTRHARAVFAALVTAGAMTVPVAAHAFDWYGGLSLGQAGHEVTGGDLAGPGFSGSVDGNDSAWKVLLGMSLWDKYVGAEFGYIDMGTASARGTVSGSSVTAITEAKAYTAAIAGLIPMGDQLGLIIKLGLSTPKADVTVTRAGVSTTSSATDMKVFGGLGLQYDFSKSTGVRLEAERFNMGSIGSPYVNLLTVGLVYRFGK
jgi:opacity protein-like surface antigen